MTEKPEALRLAEQLDRAPYSSACTNAAAAELRRLHEENQKLLEALIQARMHLAWASERLPEVDAGYRVTDNMIKYVEERFCSTTPPAQRQWVDLTNEEINEILRDPNIAELHQVGWLVLPYAYARALEAKLNQKNT